MGLKDEFKHRLKNALHDVDVAVSKAWEVTYEGQTIRFENSMNNERLFINGELVDEVTHQSLLSHLKPYSKLTSTIKRTNGRLEKVSVKIGGFIKLAIQIKVGKQIVLKEKISIEVLPWAEKERIVQFIEKQVEEHGRIINQVLPDANFLHDVDEVVDPGYLDYIGYDHPLPLFERNLVKQLKQLLEKPTTKRRRIIYEKVNDEYVATYGAKLLQYLQIEQLDNERLQEEALWFLNNATHREVVKFALLLLGLTDVEAYKEKLYTIALHEEFTPYVLLSFSHLEKDAHQLMWKLANELTGWGKVSIMLHIDAVTQDEKIWFLKQTFPNARMNEAVALIVAYKAEFDVILADAEIEIDLFTQINAVLFYLLTENEDGEYQIDDYQFAPVVLRQFIQKAKKHNDNPKINLTIDALKQYIDVADEIWEERFEGFWEQHDRESLVEKLKQL